MKTRIIALFAGLLAVLPMTSAWAGGSTHSTHYGKLSVSLANGCTGMGKVYVGTSSTATDGDASRTWNCGGSSGSDANAFYCITEPTDSAKYEFDGWFTSADAAGTPESTSKAYKPSFSASATSSGSPTAKTYYAKFHELVLFTVNFNQPSEGGSYTVKDGSTSITDASVTQMATMSLTLTPTINEGYAFVRWDITQGGKTTQNANKTVSNLKVTSDTTIALVLRKMPYYTVTFVPPENGGSYAVDGTAVGADGTSKSGYDSVSAKLTATPASGWKMGDKGWYTLDGDGKKTYFSQAESISSQKFEANVTVGVDFVEKAHFDVTFLPAANGTYTAENVEETGSQVTVAGQGGVVRGFDTLKAKLVATPAKGYVLDKWYKVNEDGSSEYFATTATANYTFEGAARAGAIFTPRKQVDVTVQGEGFTCTCTNDAIDYEETETGFVGYDSAALTFTATANPTQRAKWWYKTSEDAEPTYFSLDRSVSKTFDEDVIVGVEYEAISGSLADLIASAEGNEVTLSADANVPEGTSAEIPAGMTVTVPSGVTLWVDGTLTVNGTLTAEGTVSKCSKILRQTGNGIVPCDCYGAKYWKSAIESSKASVSWAGGTPSLHLSACSADGRVVRGAITVNTKFVSCTFGTGAAKNSIKSIGAASESSNMTEEGSFILLDNATITGPTVKEGDGGKYTRLGGTRTIEASGKTVSVTYSQISSSFRADTFNGTINFKAGSYWQGGKGAFYNCKSITVNKLKNTANYFDLYDSGDTMSFSTYDSSGKTRLLVYGTKTTFNFSSSYVDSTTTKIYGGAFKERPADNLRGDTSKEFYLEDDGYYHLEPRRDRFVAKIGDTTYESIGDAFKALADTDDATLSLYSPVTVAEPFTLPAGKSLTVELGGCRIDAPNGFIKNYGTLVIRDNDNRLEQSMIVTANGANVVETFDGGKTDICYGRYQGDFTVNGGTLTTHNGIFYGSVVNNGGEVKLLGGRFAMDVSGLVGEGYVSFRYDGFYYAARFPEPICANSSVAEFGFTLTALESSEKSLYVNKALLPVTKCADASEWMHVAELKSTYEMWGHYYFDILLKVDRDVADRTTKATVKSFGEYLPALTGGTEQRVFTPQITQTKISYKRFINDTEEHNYDTLTAGMDNYSDANIGTTFTLTMELWNWEPGSIKTDPNRPMHSYLRILTRPYVFGAGSNVAMLQTPSGKVPDENFFPTLAAAVASAATTDKTVKLCNNCKETVTVGKACTIDTNGFVFEGEVKAASGYAVSEESDGKYMVSKVETPDAPEVEVETTDSTGSGVSITIVPSEELVEQVKAEVGDGATPEQIAEEVGKKMQETSPATGLKGWQEETLKEAGVNVTGTVVGSGNGAIKNTAAADGATSQNDVKVTYDVTVGGTTDAGKAVAGVSLAKVVVAVSGEKTYDEVNGAKSDTKVLAQNFAELEAGVYQPMIVIEVVSKDDKKVELSIPNPNADRIVVQKPLCKAGEPKIIAVPGGMIGQGETVPIDKVIDTSALKDGDKVTFYNKKTQGYESWTYAGGWTSDFNANSSASGESPAADTVNVSAGSAIWFTAASDKPVTVVAQQKKGIATKVDSEGWNLLANPLSNSVNLNDVIPEGEAKTGDQIVLPLEGADGSYQGQVNLVKKDGKWGRYKANVSGGRMTMVWSTEDAVVGSGAGIWFISNGSKPTFQWGNSEQAK